MNFEKIYGNQDRSSSNPSDINGGKKDSHYVNRPLAKPFNSNKKGNAFNFKGNNFRKSSSFYKKTFFKENVDNIKQKFDTLSESANSKSNPFKKVEYDKKTLKKVESLKLKHQNSPKAIEKKQEFVKKQKEQKEKFRIIDKKKMGIRTGKLIKKDNALMAPNMQRLYVIALLICMCAYVFLSTTPNWKNPINIYMNGEKFKYSKDAKLIDGQIAISVNDVKKLFGIDCVYNQTKNEIITTNDTHVGRFLIGSTKCNINGNDIDIVFAPFVENGKVYIPLEALKNIYEFDYITKNTSALIFMKKDPLKQVILKEGSKIKSFKSIFSGTLEITEKQKKAYLVKEESKWDCIITDDLVRGYVQKKDVESIISIREKQQDNKKEQIHFIKNYDNYKENFDNVQKSDTMQNAALISNFYITPDFKIVPAVPKNNNSYAAYEKNLDSHNIQKWGVIKFEQSTSKEKFDDNLNDFDFRKELINNIQNIAITFELKGVCLDLSGINDIAQYTRLIKEIKPRLLELGISLAIFENQGIDKEVVDYTIQ